MTFVSGYRMILIQSYIMSYNDVVINKNNYYSFENDRVWPRNAIFTECRSTLHGTVRKGHKVGIIQAVTVRYRTGIFQVPFAFKVNKLCSDNTKICLDIGPPY